MRRWDPGPSAGHEHVAGGGEHHAQCKDLLASAMEDYINRDVPPTKGDISTASSFGLQLFCGS